MNIQYKDTRGPCNCPECSEPSNPYEYELSDLQEEYDNLKELYNDAECDIEADKIDSKMDLIKEEIESLGGEIEL